ncbi:hypothetical protein BH09BAC3_BH09BAC3_14110 [soil metagenome]
MLHDSIGILIGFVIAPFIVVAMAFILIVGCLDEIRGFVRERFELGG